ncbi:BET1-like protein isoform X2 [Myiozetetes cayanensis]|uniref:BET1-like protein isoform X2 n=1 Tax=Myiozetetes cayanensis TaxID=478635 RepID=UPI0021604404|nr:BET1-like protein isoform X2 [Myiozetetes cayanensis]
MERRGSRAGEYPLAPGGAPIFSPTPPFRPRVWTGSGRTCGRGSLGGQRRPFRPGPGERPEGPGAGEGEGEGGGGRTGGHFAAAPPGEAGRAGAAMAERGRGQSPSAMDDLLDVENKRMTDSLASKVTRLKSGLLSALQNWKSSTSLQGNENHFPCPCPRQAPVCLQEPGKQHVALLTLILVVLRT